MKIAEILFIALMAYGIWSTRRSLRQSTTPLERTLVVRGAMAFWLLGFVFFLGVLFLPGKWRLLFLLPAFMVGSTALGAYRKSRARLRAEEQERVSFERMKRTN